MIQNERKKTKQEIVNKLELYSKGFDDKKHVTANFRTFQKSSLSHPFVFEVSFKTAILGVPLNLLASKILVTNLNQIVEDSTHSNQPREKRYCP